MKISRIIHKNEHRLKIEFPYDQSIIAKIKKIPECKWSKTMNAWHIPYTTAAIETLKKVFPEIENYELDQIGEESQILSQLKKNDDTNTKPVLKKEAIFPDIVIEVSEKSIFIKIPKNETDIQFIRSFIYARWDKSNFKWVIPNYGKNFELLKNYFGDRIVKIEFKAEVAKKIIQTSVHPPFEGELSDLDETTMGEISKFKIWMTHKR